MYQFIKQFVCGIIHEFSIKKVSCTSKFSAYLFSHFIFGFQRIERGWSGLGDPACFHKKKTRLHSDSNCFTTGDNLSFGPLTLINLFGTGLVLADCSTLISKSNAS